MTAEITSLLSDMIADDKKSIDIARAVITQIMITEDDYTDLSEKQIVHLAVLESVQGIIQSPFLKQFIESFKRLRKSKNRQDRKEAVKMVQALREEQDGVQSKLKNLLGLGT